MAFPPIILPQGSAGLELDLEECLPQHSRAHQVCCVHVRREGEYKDVGVRSRGWPRQRDGLGGFESTRALSWGVHPDMGNDRGRAGFVDGVRTLRAQGLVPGICALLEGSGEVGAKGLEACCSSKRIADQFAGLRDRHQVQYL